MFFCYIKMFLILSELVGDFYWNLVSSLDGIIICFAFHVLNTLFVFNNHNSENVFVHLSCCFFLYI